MFKSKIAILNSGSSLVIVSPASDIIHPRFLKTQKNTLIYYAFYYTGADSTE